ncbi:phage terminase large subunit family protein [Falsiroseomonas sp. E2-1-a4]
MLRPPPQLTVSEWAERHRMLGSRASAEPGPWRTSRTPYLKDVMDALSAVHPARRVVFMKGAQVGATEGGNNWLGYIMHHVPAPALAVQPTVELAKRFSRQRIDPLLEETPALRERVAPARARDSGNTMLSKEFPGGILVLTRIIHEACWYAWTADDRRWRRDAVACDARRRCGRLRAPQPCAAPAGRHRMRGIRR